MKTLKRAAFVVLIVAVSCSLALSSEYEEDSDFDTYEEGDSLEANTYRDPYGYTTGTIAGEEAYLYTDEQGYTTGRIGEKEVYCYTDDQGYTTCN